MLLGEERKLIKGATQTAIQEAKLEHYKNFLLNKVVQLWKRLSRDDVASASMVVFKPWLI